ncbi:MAG: NAD-dependent epimerase/dehydratase family protein [Gaiellaceae bacterium]
MRVLVTGHHGYIGSVTVPALVAAGHDVVGADTRFYEGCDLFEGVAPAEERWVDVRDLTAADLDGFDAIIHLAALSNDPLGDFAPELTAEINYGATLSLARAAREAGVERFVFASSCSMYGTQDAETPVNEDAPLQPLTAYAESKVRSERELAPLASDGFSPIFMRNATAYGASPRLRLDIVLNNLVGWAVTTGSVKIMSDGTPWRPLVHVQDIARATAALLEAPRELVHGKAFNIGGGEENYQVRELGEIVRETVPECTVEYAGSGDPDPRSYRVDFGVFARTFPEFRFEWDARRGAAELRDAYQGSRLTLDDFEGDRFVRLRRLRLLLDGGRLDDRLRWQPAGAAA